MVVYVLAPSPCYHLFRLRLIMRVPAHNCHIFTHVTDTHNRNPQRLGQTSLHGPRVSYVLVELMITLLFLASACAPSLLW